MSIKLQAPIEVEIKVSVISEDGTQGTVTIGLAKGKFPTEEEMREVIASAPSHLPDGFRLMTKREWFDSVVGKVYDGEDDDGNPVYLSAAIPGGNEWEA